MKGPALIQLAPEPDGVELMLKEGPLAGYRGLMGDAQAIVEWANGAVKITTPEEAAAATDKIAGARRIVAALEEQRLGHVKPLDARKRAFQLLFARPQEQLEAVVSVVQSRLKAFMLEQEAMAKARAAAAAQREQEAAERQATALADENAPGAGVALLEATQDVIAARQELEDAVPIRGIKTEQGSASGAWHWTWKVVKIEDVPEQYLKPREVNKAALDAAVKAGARQIPGIEIYEDLDVTTRRR